MEEATKRVPALAVISGEHGLEATADARGRAAGGARPVPLPRLLVLYGAARETGLLTLSTEASMRTVFFRNGLVVWVESSESRETFLEWLMARRVVTVDGAVRARRLVRDGACRLGEALVRCDALDADALAASARRFVISVVGSAFAWRFGTYRFAPAGPVDLPVEPSVVAPPIMASTIVVEGFRRMSDLGLVTLWLGDLGARRVIAGDPYQLAEAYTPSESEVEMLKTLASGSFSILEAVRSGPLDPPETIRLLGMLDALGALGTL